jgi:hypothetical protein
MDKVTHSALKMTTAINAGIGARRSRDSRCAAAPA